MSNNEAEKKGGEKPAQRDGLADPMQHLSAEVQLAEIAEKLKGELGEDKRKELMGEYEKIDLALTRHDVGAEARALRVQLSRDVQQRFLGEQETDPSRRAGFNFPQNLA